MGLMHDPWEVVENLTLERDALKAKLQATERALEVQKSMNALIRIRVFNALRGVPVVVSDGGGVPSAPIEAGSFAYFNAGEESPFSEDKR